MFFDLPKDGKHHEKRAILGPILRTGLPNFATGTFRSTFWVPKSPIPSLEGDPKGSELVGHPVCQASVGFFGPLA